MTFSARFSLFPTKEKTKETSPDVGGNVEILETDVASLIEYLAIQDAENRTTRATQL